MHADASREIVRVDLRRSAAHSSSTSSERALAMEWEDDAPVPE
jgi:hypothetical protein